MENSLFSFFRGNWVDLIIIVFIGVFLMEGFRKGFVAEILELIGFLLSFFLALKYYNIAAVLLRNNFSLPRGIANSLGFLLIGFLTEIIFSSIVFYLIRKVVKFSWDNFWEKILGIIPSFLNALITLAFVLTLIIAFPINGRIKDSILKSKIGGKIISFTIGTEKDLNKIFGGAINETLTFLTIEKNGEEKVDLKFKVLKKDLKIDEISEKKMLVLVNEERVKNGLLELTDDVLLREVARSHCFDMFENGYFSHYSLDNLSPFDRLKNAGVSYSAAGENLALAQNVEIAHNGLMNSPSHRENILSSDFGKVGIGIVDGGIFGEMFCQEFSN